MKTSTSSPDQAAKMAPLLSSEALAETTQAIGGIFQRLIDDATLMAALKFQETEVKKRVEKRSAEYEKARIHHDKYPSIKESQTGSKTEADRSLKTISEKLSQKHSILKGYAMEAAEKLIPALIAHCGRNTTAQENLQRRVDSLEKTGKGQEKLIQDQGKLLEGQRKTNQVLEDKLLALAKSIEQKHLALEKDLQEKHLGLSSEIRTLQSQSASNEKRLENDMAQVQKKLQQVENSEQTIETLKTNLSAVKGDIAKISTENAQLSSDLKDHALKIGPIPTLGQDILNLQKELKKVNTTSKGSKDAEEFKKLSEKLGMLENNHASLVTHLTRIAKAQGQINETCTGLEGRVDEMAKRPDPTGFESRLQQLEKPRDAFVTKSDLNALEGRVRQIERTPPLAQHPLPAQPNSKSHDSRLEALEKASNSRKTLDMNLEERLRGIEGVTSLRTKEIADFKKRVAAVENQQRSSTSAPIPATDSRASTTATNTQPRFDELSAQIQVIQRNLEGIKDGQEAHDETWTSVLDDRIEEKLQVRISPLEDSLSKLGNNLENLTQSTTLDDNQKAIFVKEATTKVIAAFMATPDLLPFLNVEKTTYVMNQALAPIHQSIEGLKVSYEATNHSLGNLQTRVDNINTLDLSRHALGQLYELHPDLQRIEGLMIGFKTDMHAKNTQIEELNNNVKALQGAIQNIEANAQVQQTAETMAQQYQELRKEVESLTDDGVNIARKMKALADDLEKALQGITDLRNESNSNKQTIANQFARFTDDLEEKIEKSKDSLEEKIKKASEPLPRPFPVVSQVSQRSSSTQNGIGRGPPKPSFSTANRQPSASGAKKRKLDNATKTNGVRPSSSSGSPNAKKRQRKAFGDDDPEDDPDYHNEEIQEPGVSTDEE
jgi:chromosome segregation ATPase